MHFLLVNDDGIGSVGIMALMEAALKRGHRVSMCAPSGQMSAASHRITLSDPLYVKDYPLNRENAEGFAITGTPADCVRLAFLGGLVTDPVDGVISGINNGYNAGLATYYSGTVGAAREGALLGYPAIAASIDYKADPAHVQDAAELVLAVAEKYCQAPQDGFRVLAVTACPNGIAHTYMAAEALTKAGDKLGLPTKVETNGSDGAKNILTRAEIAACDGIIVAAEKKVDTARFDGKPVLFTRVDDGIHKPEELIKKIAHGEVPVFHAEGGAAAEDDTAGKDSFGRSLYKNLMNGVSHMLPFVVGGGIMIALAFLLDDYSINPANFGMNTPVAAFFKTVGGAAFGYMLPILAGFIAMSIADRPGLAVGFAGGVLAMNGTNFTDLAAGSTTGISGGFLAALLAGFAAGYIVQFLKKITEKLPASLNGIRPMLIYPLGGILIVGAMMCAVNPVMGMINTAMTDWLNALGGSSKVLLGAIVAGMMSVDMGGPVNKAAYVFGTAALASGNYEVMAAVMVGGMVPPIAIALSTTFCPRKWTLDERRNGIVNYVMGLCFVSEGAIPYAAVDPLRVLPSCVVGSAVAGALSMTFGCALRAPHGGIFVFPVVDHAALYCVALAVGSVLGAVILSLVKKTQPAEAK